MMIGTFLGVVCEFARQ